MAIRIRHHGSFERTYRFSEKMSTDDIFAVLNAAGRAGVDALASATPKDSGVTAASWSFETEKRDGSFAIHWTNDHIIQGFSIVIGLQYGHGTGTGGYVVGRDFINPAIRPIFEVMAETVWREVVNA